MSEAGENIGAAMVEKQMRKLEEKPARKKEEELDAKAKALVDKVFDQAGEGEMENLRGVVEDGETSEEAGVKAQEELMVNFLPLLLAMQHPEPNLKFEALRIVFLSFQRGLK